MSQQPDYQRAAQLLANIRNAWREVPIPRLPNNLRSDFEFGRSYNLVADREWWTIDLDHRKLIGEEWILWLPDECQLYYFAAYLAYCVNFPKHRGKVEMPFLFALGLAKLLPPRVSHIPKPIADCVREALAFIKAHRGLYYYNAEIVDECVDPAIEAWKNVAC